MLWSKNAGTPYSNAIDNALPVNELVSSQQPKYKKTEQEHLKILSSLNREFDVATPNQVWCADVTYI